MLSEAKAVHERFVPGQNDPIITETCMPIEDLSITKILNERGSRYGSFKSHAEITQGIKYYMHNSANWDIIASDQAEALDMIAHKIGRILNGDPDYDDSWIDIVGYTQLVVDRLKEDQRKASNSVNLKRA
jgi:hypothetical protein